MKSGSKVLSDLKDLLHGGAEKTRAVRVELWRTLPIGIKGALCEIAQVDKKHARMSLSELPKGIREQLLKATEQLPDLASRAIRALRE